MEVRLNLYLDTPEPGNAFMAAQTYTPVTIVDVSDVTYTTTHILIHASNGYIKGILASRVRDFDVIRDE